MDLWPEACDGDTCCTPLHSAIDRIQGLVCADIAQSTGIKGESSLCFPVRHLTLQIELLGGKGTDNSRPFLTGRHDATPVAGLGTEAA